MQRLSHQAFRQARSFIFERGRALDQRLFEFHFESGSQEAVLREVASYQNADGGFCRIEPDLMTDASSALAATVAFQVLREVGAFSESPITQKGIRYFLDTYDRERMTWPIIPPQADAAPHAPWWNYPKTEKVFAGFLLNPRAEILGYLWEYPESVPSDMLEALASALSEHLDTLPQKMDMNDMLCTIRLADTPNLPEETRRKVVAKLTEAVPHTVDMDPSDWSSHCLKPLWVAPTPRSPFSDVLADALDRNLDYEIENQDPRGCWMPSWSWYGQFPEAWEEASVEWQSHLTLGALKSLHAYDRIEGLR
ncbi:MAG: hypothetical protein QGI83_07725 [Candidatus Latescibacteria bacterium]|nr:hypothetical protein [Candidatus Latescibacterota bacterium]